MSSSRRRFRGHAILVELIGTVAFLCARAPLRAQDLAAAPDAPAFIEPSMFVVPAGLEVTVWATTPLLFNPTNIDFDHAGRLWVAEGVNYRGHSKRRPDGDRIVVLTDTDLDGRADQSSVFVQEPNLVAPLGIAVLDNQIIVSQPPDLIAYTDVDRDQKFNPAVDRREVLLTGFNGRNHDHSLHSVTAGPDGAWYWNHGNTGAQFTDKSGQTFRIGSPYAHGGATRQVVDSTQIAGDSSDDGHVWIGGFTARMQPDASHVTILAHNYRNSYEQTVTSFGDIFQSDNDDPPACRVTALIEGGNAGFASRDGKRSWSADRRPGQSVPIAEWRQEDPGSMPAGDVYGGGSPTGIAFYENGALGEKWRGLLLACDAGRNVVFGYQPKSDGAGFRLTRFDFLTSNRQKRFAGSDFVGGGKGVTHARETLFRPSDVAVGPDGALYVADWFDARVGGHADLDKATAGTIYRIAPRGFKPRIPNCDFTTIEGQLLALKSPAANVRFAGFARLRGGGARAIAALTPLLKSTERFLAARATWLLAQMGDAGVAKITPLLDAKNDTTRLVAYRALRAADHDVLWMAQRMATDPSPAIRRDVALTMRDVPFAQSGGVLREIAARLDAQDRSYLEAFGIGCTGKEREVFAALRRNIRQPPAQWPASFAAIAWRLGSPDAVADLKSRALSSALDGKQRRAAIDAIAFIKAPEAADAMLDLATLTDFPLHEYALWWINNRRTNEWKAHHLTEAMKGRGLIQEPPLVSVISPEPPATPSQLPQTAEIAKLTGEANRGETAIAVCRTCHKIGTSGIEFGPDLTSFAATQPREVVINAILNPSAEISHGFEGSRVETTDGLIIDGIVVGNDDPVIVKSTGGQTQNVPRERLKSVKPLGRSLMMAPETLGLSAQSIADIATFLQQQAARAAPVPASPAAARSE